MSHIRNTIELLSTILKENGTVKIKAETFRLAKFNQNDVTELLWKLLFQLLYYCENGIIDSVTYKACSDLTKEELTVYVKRMLQRRGYYSQEFAILPNDMTTGSRELLLAVGWIVCKENIIQRFMQSCTSPLDSNNDMIAKQSSEPVFEPPILSENVVDRVKQMLWFNNKLRMNLRLLYATQQEKVRLQHKIHEATYGVSADPERNHLTLYEVYLLRHPDLLKKNLELLEQDNERLKHLLKWKDHEDIFWKWMESVLDEKVKEDLAAEKEAEISNISTSTQLKLTNSSLLVENSINFLAESHHHLQDIIMKYEYIVDQLESLWDSKSVDIQEADLDNILCEIDQELFRQRANISQINYDMYVQTQNSQPRFIYEKQTENKSSLISTGATVFDAAYVNTDLKHIQNIQDEILMLHGAVETLQTEIDSKQENFKSELQDISDGFQQAVCIPPMGRRSYNVVENGGGDAV